MKYPIEKYTFRHYKEKNEDGTESFVTVALTKYRGKVVKGVAKCCHDDTFDVEVGKKLAALRCNEKVCRKRKQILHKHLSETVQVGLKVSQELGKLTGTFNECIKEWEDAQTELAQFIETIG